MHFVAAVAVVGLAGSGAGAQRSAAAAATDGDRLLSRNQGRRASTVVRSLMPSRLPVPQRDAPASPPFAAVTPTFGGLGHFHRGDAKFPFGDLIDGLCLQHYLLSKMAEVKANWRRGPAINRKLVNNDARRGDVLRFDELESIAASASPIILAPATIDMFEFRAQLQDDEFRSAWPATLTAAVPGLTPELMETRLT